MDELGGRCTDTMKDDLVRRAYECGKREDDQRNRTGKEVTSRDR